MRRKKVVSLGVVSVAVFACAAYILGRPPAAVDEERVEVFLDGARACTEEMIPHECLNVLVLEKAPLLGVPTLIVGIREAAARHPEAFLVNCHRAAHYLGEYAGETIGVLDEALALGDPFCQFGYYHGVVEGYARVTPTLFEELPGLCYHIDADVTSTGHAECSHSLGHAIVTRTDNDVAEGIRYCRALRTRDERKACTTGIFMSWSNSLDKALHARDRDGSPVPEKFLIAPVDQRWLLCVPLDTEMAEACVHFLAETAPSQPVVGEVAFRQMREFTSWCEDTFVGRESVVLACHGAVGRVAGADAVFGPLGGWPGVVEFCLSAGSSEAFDACTRYAYTSGSQFDANITETACRAWDGRPEQDDQCALIRELHSKVVAPLNPVR